MTIPDDTLVLVADGRKALFLRNRGDEQQIDLRTASHRERADHKDGDIKTDAAGRSGRPAGAGAFQDTMEEPDFHQQEEDRFARDLSEKVNAMALAGEFDDLVVVAPARTMGELAQGGAEPDRGRACQGNDRPPDFGYRGAARR